MGAVSKARAVSGPAQKMVAPFRSAVQGGLSAHLRTSAHFAGCAPPNSGGFVRREVRLFGGLSGCGKDAETTERSLRFRDLDLSPATQKALSEVFKLDELSSSQKRILPCLLGGASASSSTAPADGSTPKTTENYLRSKNSLDLPDAVVRARTGTGKTLGYLVPMVEHVYRRENATNLPPGVRGLVVAPARELAVQITAETEKLLTFHTESAHHHLVGWNSQSANLPGGNESLGATSRETREPGARPAGGGHYEVIPLVGGVNRKQDCVFIKQKKPSFIVGTPGRLIDHFEQTFMFHALFQHLEVLVLDEVDRLCDMGFLDKIKQLLSYLPEKKRCLLFSATVPEAIQTVIAPRYLLLLGSTLLGTLLVMIFFRLGLFCYDLNSVFCFLVGIVFFSAAVIIDPQVSECELDFRRLQRGRGRVRRLVAGVGVSRSGEEGSFPTREERQARRREFCGKFSRRFLRERRRNFRKELASRAADELSIEYRAELRVLRSRAHGCGALRAAPVAHSRARLQVQGDGLLSHGSFDAVHGCFLPGLVAFLGARDPLTEGVAPAHADGEPVPARSDGGFVHVGRERARDGLSRRVARSAVLRTQLGGALRSSRGAHRPRGEVRQGAPDTHRG